MKDLATHIDFDPELDFAATPIWLLDEGHCTPAVDPPFSPGIGVCFAITAAAAPWNRPACPFPEQHFSG